MPELGIENIDKIARIGNDLISTAKTRLADGFQIGDLFAFAPILMDVEEIPNSVPHVWSELHDLDGSEIVQLIGYISVAVTELRVQFILTGILYLFAGAIKYFPES